MPLLNNSYLYQHAVVMLFALVTIIWMRRERQFPAIICGLILLQISHILFELVLFLSHWGEVSVDPRRIMAHLIQTGWSATLNCWVLWFFGYIQNYLNSTVTPVQHEDDQNESKS